MIRFARTLQRHWDWRAAGNFVLGGTGGMLLALAPVAGGGTAATLVALALVGAGLLCVWMEIGRPWRALNVFRHPQRSWMTREALVASAAFALALTGLLTGSPVLAWLAGACGVAFVYCQARILMAARGVPAWRQREIVPLVLSTGLAEGSAVLMAALAFGAGAPTWLAWLLVAAVVVRAIAWARYRAALVRDDAPAATIASMSRVHRWLLAGGTAVPFVAASIAALSGPGIVASATALLAALCALLAGWWFKFVLVTRASQLQGYAFGKLRTGHPLAGARAGRPRPHAATGFNKVLEGDNR